MTKTSVKLGHRQRATSAHVWTGGSGPAVVLLHGAWAGARAHWAPVWDTLARHHRVIAPELPGIVPDSGSGDPRGSYAEYADWVTDLMDALQCDSAHVVGNSLGATIAWYLAVQHPGRSRSLTLVNGAPPPPMAGWLRFVLLNSALMRSLAHARVRKTMFSRAALQAGFAKDERVPDVVRYGMGAPDERQIHHLLAMGLRSRVPVAVPRQPTLLLWGAQDRLPLHTPAYARELQARVPGARLELVDDAGHLPQVEQPERVAEAMLAFMGLNGG